MASRRKDNGMRVELFSIGKFTIYGYGFMIAVGILACILLAYYRAPKYNLNPEAILDIAIWGVVVGFIGAKLLYVIVEFPTFIQDPWSILGSEGFVVYGGIAAGVGAGALYCKKKGYVFLEYFDLAAPSIAIAQGFGRIGCLLAGCCYGRETASFLGITFPEGALAPAGVKLLPTQLISSAGDFLIMFILLFYHKRAKHTGDVGALYMLLYAIGRFSVEFLRNDDRGAVAFLSTSQAISILIFALALFLFHQNKKRPKHQDN